MWRIKRKQLRGTLASFVSTWSAAIASTCDIGFASDSCDYFMKPPYVWIHKVAGRQPEDTKHLPNFRQPNNLS